MGRVGVMREEGACVDIPSGLSIDVVRDQRGSGREEGHHDVKSTHPGSLSVLFIENAKCFPSDVNSSGR